MIPYGRQDVNQADIDAVIDILKSDWLTQGPSVGDFEKTLCKKVGAEYAVAVNSATSALHLACLALDLGSGDWLWTSPNSFVASANCALYCGANVDFVDIDPHTYNISIDALQEKLIFAEKNGTLPKILIPVHFAGQSCDMEAIAVLSKKYGFKIIEDASHAIGGKYQNRSIGDCFYSDMTIFSFHPVKIITTGEGGAILTNQSLLHERILQLRSHGITRDSQLMKNFSHGPWYYEQVHLGFNYRLTDIQAGLGLSQIKRLEMYIDKRHDIAAIYQRSLSALPLVLPYQSNQAYSAYHLYVIQIDPSKVSITREHLFFALHKAGIGVNVHYIPIHTQPYYQQLGFSIGDFPEAERYYKNALSLPMYPTLTRLDQEKVIKIIQENLQ